VEPITKSGTPTNLNRVADCVLLSTEHGEELLNTSCAVFWILRVENSTQDRVPILAVKASKELLGSGILLELLL